MLQVRLNLKVNLFHLKSICFNPGQLGALAVTNHRSQVIVLPIQKVT